MQKVNATNADTELEGLFAEAAAIMSNPDAYLPQAEVELALV